MAVKGPGIGMRDRSVNASVAEWVARFLAARGPSRVFGLQGGHVQPIWDRLGVAGIPIVDVRHEGAAVHMSLDRVPAGADVPNDCNVVIEIPMRADPIKYEVDKETGAVFVDRFMRSCLSSASRLHSLRR